jgi:competence protein ComEC
MKRPLVCLAAVFCLGIIFTNLTRIHFLVFYILALISLILSFLALKQELRFDIFLLCLVFFLGALVLKNSYILPKCHILRFIQYKTDNVSVLKGLVDTQPVIKNNRISFVFKTEGLQLNNLKYKCCGSVLVYLRGKKNLAYGEKLLLQGHLYRSYNFGNSRRKDNRPILYVNSESAVISLNKNKGLMLKRFALWLKEKMEGIIFQHVSNLPASILDAMVLGERRSIPKLISNSMVKSGTVHILVVSGFNVGIVASIIITFLKLIRLPRNLRLYIAIPCLIVYCLMTGASTPVVRATVMAIVFLLGYIWKRQPDIYNSCAIAAIIILGVNPAQLFDASFQLSFASVLSIVYLYPTFKSFLNINSLKVKFIRFLLEGCLVSFSAWIGTMGFIAYYFQMFSPITVIANIFTVPLATLITLCGFSLIMTGLICPPLVSFLASSSELVVALLLETNILLIKIPGAYFYLGPQ